MTALHQDAWQKFEATPFPVRTDEPWRKTDPGRFKIPAQFPQRTDIPEQKNAVVSSPLLSGEFERRADKVTIAAPPAGFDVLSLETEAGSLSPDIQKLLIPGRSTLELKFSLLNDAQWREGVVVYVPKGAVIEKPFRSFFTAGKTEEFVFPRTVIVVDEGASLTFIDDFTSDPEWKGLGSAVVDIVIKQGGFLRYVTAERLSKSGRAMIAVRAHLERDSKLEALSLTAGGGVVKSNVEVHLEGPGAEAHLSGLIVPKGRQHFDTTVLVRHTSSNAVSNLLYRAALKDFGRSVFTGLIEVPRGSQKTDSYQACNNLLLSPTAHADATPKLEILADDVKCSHGATVGSVDEEQVFYLESRGVPRPEAEALIIEGFFQNVFNRLTVGEHQKWVTGWAARAIEPGHEGLSLAPEGCDSLA